MKREYEIRWYEYELTKPCRKKFLTRAGATLYAIYISKKQNAKVLIYRNGKVIGISK
jgi:hypothetical protein